MNTPRLVTATRTTYGWTAAEPGEAHTAFLRPGSTEWYRAWTFELPETVRLGGGTFSLEPCPETGEVWQYMSSHMGWLTYPGRAPEGQPGWIHQFRHRSYDGARAVVNVRASRGWTPEMEPPPPVWPGLHPTLTAYPVRAGVPDSKWEIRIEAGETTEYLESNGMPNIARLASMLGIPDGYVFVYSRAPEPE